MKRYLLDTSLVAAYLHSRKPAMQLIRPLIERHEVAASILVYAEVTEYIKGLLDATQRQHALRSPFRGFTPIFSPTLFLNAVLI